MLVLLSLLTFFAMAYFAITLSHTLFRDKKWRTWVALLIFVGVYWGLSLSLIHISEPTRPY